MTLQEIKDMASKYNCKLVRCTDIPTTDFVACIQNITDFFTISKDEYVLYKETEITQDDVSEKVLDYAHWYAIKFGSEFIDWVDGCHKEDIRHIISRENMCYFELYSFKYRLSWGQRFGLSGDDKFHIENYIDEYKKEYDTETREEEDDLQKSVGELLNNYRKEYFQSKTKTAKKEILSTISAKLKKDYGIDGRSNPRYSKFMLHLLLEGGVEGVDNKDLPHEGYYENPAMWR